MILKNMTDEDAAVMLWSFGLIGTWIRMDPNIDRVACQKNTISGPNNIPFWIGSYVYDDPRIIIKENI